MPSQKEWSDLMKSIGRIETRQETFIEQIEKHDGRIAKVERFTWRMQGMAALVAASVAFIYNYFKGGGNA